MNLSPTETIEIACRVVAANADAWKISDGYHEVWIGKSQITDFIEDQRSCGKFVSSIFVPVWLARDKGLI
jgi:hypothetical protein